MAVVEQVSESGPPRGNYVSQPAAGSGRNFLELHAIEVTKELWSLCPGRSPILLVDSREDMAIDYKQILKAIIIEIEEAGSPSQERNRRFHESRLISGFGKNAVPFAAEQHIVVVGEI